MWSIRYQMYGVYVVVLFVGAVSSSAAGAANQKVKTVSRPQAALRDVPPTRSSVSSTPALRDLEPLFTLPIGNVTAALGREAALTCTVTDIGDYKVAWIRVDDQTILTLHNRVVTHSSRYAVTNDSPRAWTLHVRPLRIEDRGCYMCQINTSPMKKQVGCIDVLVPPNIVDEGSSSDLVIREGEDARLTCRADGRPPPRFLWRREDGAKILMRSYSGDIHKVSVYSGAELNLTKVERRQMGAYLCIASNDVPPSVSKRILLTVNFPPSVLAANQLIGVSTGSNAHLECLVEAKPSTDNYWLKNGQDTIIEGDNNAISEEVLSPYQLKLIMIISKFRPQDVGSYTCVAASSMGKSEATIRLHEIKTTTTSTTTSSTTTPPPPPPPTTTLHRTSTRAVVPYPPAEQMLFTPDVTTYDTMTNVMEQSVLDNSWLPTVGSARSNTRTAHIIHPTLTFGLLIFYLTLSVRHLFDSRSTLQPTIKSSS